MHCKPLEKRRRALASRATLSLDRDCSWGEMLDTGIKASQQEPQL